MLKADEDGRMLFFHKWNRETGHLLTKISNFVQFNDKKHFLAV